MKTSRLSLLTIFSYFLTRCFSKKFDFCFFNYFAPLKFLEMKSNSEEVASKSF